MEKFNLPVKKVLIGTFLLLLLSQIFLAQNVITILPYTPGLTNFDTYNPSSQANAANTLPSGWSFSSSGVAAYGGQVVVAPSAGAYYAYSVLLGSDFNLGAQRDVLAGNITYNVNYTNNTGGLITTLVFSWNYEQWRFANSSGFSCFGTGALAGNVTLGTKGFIGSSSSFLNLPTTNSISSFTLSGLSIANGASFGVAWITTDDTGADNGVAIDDFSMSASSIASITIANPTISAAPAYQSINNHVLYRTDITVGITPSILNSASFITAGTYLSNNLSNLKLWYSTNSVFSATATLLSTKSTTLGPGTKAFTGLTQTFPLGTGYLFLTADIPCATGIGNNISVNAISTANFIFSNGVKSGSGFTSSGIQTLTGISVNAVNTQSVCAGKNIAGITFNTSPSGLTVNWNNPNTNIGLPASGTGNIGAYTAPSVSNNINSIVTATVLNGACAGNNINFNMVVKSTGQSATAWKGIVSGNWDDSDNWTNCACTGASNVTITSVISPANAPTLSSTADVMNILLEPGAVLNGQPSTTLNVRGTWLSHGIFNAQNNCVAFSGNSAQAIGGTSITDFYDLHLNNSNSLVLASKQHLNGNLQLQSGTFNTNNLLILRAGASGGGRIGAISPAADIINDVIIQQWAPGGTTGWSLFGSSISSALTMADWNDNFAISCASCPNGFNNFTSIYSYDESVAGTYSAPAKYIPINSIGDNITAGKGYWVYFGDGATNTSDIMFDVIGNVSKSSCLTCSGPVTIPLSFTSNNGISDDGWNLISNPLPSPISWTALRNGNPNVDNAIYVYNTDMNGGLGAHTSYINGVASSPSNCVTDNIAIHQGFYVHATAPTQLTAGENIKTNSNPTFLKPTQLNKPIFRIVLKDSIGFEDMSTFYFEQGGSVNFQTDYDAYKLNFDETTTPYIGSMSSNELTSINGLPQLTSNYSIPVKAITPVTKNFTFSSLQTDFPNHVCVTLYDSYTGITTNLMTDTYTCMLYDTTTACRFTINFFTGSSVGSSSVSHPSCVKPTGGIVSAQGSGSGPWNYEWKSGNTIVKTSLNKSTSDSITGLNGGNYTLKVSTVGQCDLFSPSFAINTIVSSNADFTPETFTTTSSNSGLINFTNNSSNFSSVSWDFGDGVGSSTQVHSFYNYTTPGTYTVTLVTESSTMCRDTAKHKVEVINDVTGINSTILNEEIRLSTHGRGDYSLDFRFVKSTNLEIKLYDLKGSLLQSTSLDQVSNDKQGINLSSYPQGLYLVNVISDNRIQKTFKITH